MEMLITVTVSRNGENVQMKRIFNLPIKDTRLLTLYTFLYLFLL